MNRAFTQGRTVCDIGTYESLCGAHLSLDTKHGVYHKPNIRKLIAGHRVNVFSLTESVTLENETINRDGAWQVDYQ